MRTYIAILLLLAKLLALGPTLATHHHDHNIRDLPTILPHDHGYHHQQLEFGKDLLGFLFSNFDHGQEFENYLGAAGQTIFPLKKVDVSTLELHAFLPAGERVDGTRLRYYRSNNHLPDHYFGSSLQLRGPPTPISSAAK